MSELRVDDLIRDIAARAQAEVEPAFPQLALEQLLPVLREHSVVEPRPPLIGRSRYERAWVQINTIIRRFAAHAVEPVVAQQNEFNAALQATLEELIATDAKLRAAIVALRAERASTDHKDA